MCSKIVKLNNLQIGRGEPLVLIAGPCQIESTDHTLYIADKIAEICATVDLKFVFKSSFDKANRSSFTSKRGVGLEKGLKILQKVKDEFHCPVLTDVHEISQCEEVGSVVDIIQIPAFLSRQTDLLFAASETGKVINIKKGQFMAPWDMENVIDKIKSCGNDNILLCERGTSFGYNTIVSDFRSLPILSDLGYPVVFDATHSVQQPGGMGTSSGGQREFVPYLAKAACAVGINAIFIETHEDPDNAPSDGPNMIKINDLRNLIIKLNQIHKITNRN